MNFEDDVTTDNQGLKDQVLAFKYVKENIVNFGRNPNNVTIFGESAGGAFVHYITFSLLIKGLHYKAISQIGTIVNPWSFVAESSRAYAPELTARLGKRTYDPKESLEFLSGIDAKKLVAADSKMSAVDPLPAEPWPHVIDTSKFGPRSAQLNQTTRQLVGSDNCLYLNVYTPSDVTSSVSSLKPVMFWIHGGLFSYGSGSDTLFGPDYIVERDVVLVTINYRLNVLGFLNLEDEETTGNQGLKDQVLALKWVKENISNFGGDPDNVTIFGESSGGACVHHLTLSPLAEGLYHKAISQSGVALNPWTMTQKSPKHYAQELAAAFGEKSQDPKILAEFFRSIDAQKLAEMDSKISAAMIRQSTRCFAPSIDTKSKNPFFPVSVKISAKSGVKVPYIIGHTSHEGIVYLTGMTDALYEAADSNIETLLSPRALKFLSDKGLTSADLKRIYFGDKSISYDSRIDLMRMQSDLQFVCGIHEIAEIQASTGSRTYLYNFSYDNGRSRIKTAYGVNDTPGACHADELPYMFYARGLAQMGVPPVTSSSTDYLVVKRVAQMWTDFAKTGNPTPAVTDTVPVIWKPVENGQSLECLNIGEDLRMETVTNVNKRFVKGSSKL